MTTSGAIDVAATPRRHPDPFSGGARLDLQAGPSDHHHHSWRNHA